MTRATPDSGRMTAQAPKGPDHDCREDVAIVVIGRNEGDRLPRCLASLPAAASVIYVDSGSIDASIDQAKAAGVDVVALSSDRPFTAARGRNAGLARLGSQSIRYVQMIDGDCELQPGWAMHAASVLDADSGLVAVFGRRRERRPEASVYNRLCDAEWAVPAGEVRAFGGDVMLRREALLAAGGYSEAMVAGEDIDLALRLQQAGGRIVCLPIEMTLHDAAIERVGQWWKRTERAGHAFAELSVRHPGFYRRSVTRILFWGGVLPLLAAIGIAAGLIAPGWIWLAIAAVVLTLLQGIRIFAREKRAAPAAFAAATALFLIVGKYAEIIGLCRFHLDRWRGREARLIEYKGAAGT